MLLRKSYFHAIIVTVMLLVGIPASISPPAHGAPTYTPGVTVGDSVTYGQIMLTYNHTSGIPQGLQIFNDTKSITATVTAVDLVAKTLTMTQTYLFKNLTSFTTTLSGNVQNGNGNLSIFILAGGLSAGDPLTQSQYNNFFSFISETVTRQYAGALRTVNAVSFSTIPGTGFASIGFYWDQSTGFLLEASESVTSANPTLQQFSITIKATSTNIWTASTTPDFSLDATSQTYPFVFRGQLNEITLNLTSFQNFSGTASLTTHLLNSSIANPPTITLSQNGPTIPAGGSITSILTFTTGASTTLGLYLLTVNATVGTQQHGAEFALEVFPPDFELVATPPALNVTAGGMKTSTITVRALGLFVGTVSLSTSSDSLLQTSLDKASVTLSSTVTSVNSTLMVSPNPYIIPGSYSISVSGFSAASGASFAQHSDYIPVLVPGPDFEMSPGYSSVTISPGGTSNSAITLTSFSGFAGTVSLSASSYGGLAVSTSPSIVTLSPGTSAKAQAVISLPPGSTAGYYQAIVTGVSGIISRSVYIQVNVGGPDFSISANPSSIPFESGKTVNTTITLRSLNGFAGTLSLAASVYGNPLGYVLSSSSATLAPAKSVNSTLTISMPSTISPTSFYPSVDASNGTVTHTTYVYISPSVPPPPPPPTSNSPDFIVSDFPSVFTLPEGGSADSTVTVTSTNANINLQPGGSVNSTLHVQVVGNAPAGDYSFSVQASNATVSRYASVEVIVATPDFQVIPNVNSLTLQPGSSATPTIVLISRYNFLGTLQLNATVNYGPNGSCPGPTCPLATLSTSTVSLIANGSGNSGLTVTTLPTTAIGSYSISVTATNGTVTRSTYLNLNVIGPDFQLSSGAGSIILPAGGSQQVTINVVSSSGFSGKVNLSANTYGLNVSPDSVNVTVTSGGWTSAKFLVSAPASTNPGGYYLSVGGVNGTLSHYAYVGVIVPGPSFGVSHDYSNLDVQAGGSNSTVLTLASYDGFKSTVTLSVFSLYGPTYPVCPGPSCPTISLNPASVALNPAGWGSSSVAISFPTSAVAGSYYLNLNATSGSIKTNVYLNIVVTPAPATLVSVVQGTDGSLWWSKLSGAWSGLASLGGSTKSTPTLCSSPGRADLLVRGLNNATYLKSFQKGAWSSTWDSPPGGLTRDQPACAVLGGRLYIVIRGIDNGTWWITKNETSGVWTGWQSLGASISGPPVLVATPTESRLDLVVRGSDNGIWHDTFYGYSNFWSGWDSAGGITVGVPAVVSDGTTLHLIVRGQDNNIWYNSLPMLGPPTWSGYKSLSGSTALNAALYGDSLGNLHLIVTGTGTTQSLWHKSMTSGVWSGTWDSLGGIVTSSPSVATLGTSTLVSVRGQDGRVWYATVAGSTLTGWLTAGGIIAGDPQLGIGSA